MDDNVLSMADAQNAAVSVSVRQTASRDKSGNFPPGAMREPDGAGRNMYAGTMPYARPAHMRADGLDYEPYVAEPVAGHAYGGDDYELPDDWTPLAALQARSIKTFTAKPAPRLFGSSALAKELGVDRRTISRWHSESYLPLSEHDRLSEKTGVVKHLYSWAQIQAIVSAAAETGLRDLTPGMPRPASFTGRCTQLFESLAAQGVS